MVVFCEGDWKIQRGEGLYARYRTRQEALLDALHSARKAGKVEVYLEGDILPFRRLPIRRENLEQTDANCRQITGLSGEVELTRTR
jgi:hypothetical protein